MQYCVIFVLSIVINISKANIKEERDNLLRKEARIVTGGTAELTDKETLVNTCLMNYKNEEIKYAMKHPQYYNFSKHYFEYKDDIKNSKVYKIIRDMPKGAAVHIHDMVILGPDYLMGLTYMDNLYVCFDGNRIKFKFSNQMPNNDQKCQNWQLMSEARKNAKNLEQFNENLRNHFTLVNPNPDAAYPSNYHVWDAYITYFFTVGPLLTFTPVWEKYFYDALKAFKEENILYVEIRSMLPNLYELDGKVHSQIDTAKSYQKVSNIFVRDYPEFIGAKLIYAPLRGIDNQTLDIYLELAQEIKGKFPNLFAGFDLVGPEDLGSPLLGFFDKLSAVDDLDYFFHAGETNWYGHISDENLADAVVLQSKRIGHALALPKHPALMVEVIKRNIPIEVNVISNNVFKLVKDIRNHPLSTFLSMDIPVVLSSDSPGVWEADLLSYDFYAAFLGAASWTSDLRLLKTLALNSLNYSALKPQEKSKAITGFLKKWDVFINDFDCSRYNPQVLTLICRNNELGQEYCVQFNRAMKEVQVDKTTNDIMKNLYKL